MVCSVRVPYLDEQWREPLTTQLLVHTQEVDLYHALGVASYADGRRHSCIQSLGLITSIGLTVVGSAECQRHCFIVNTHHKDDSSHTLLAAKHNTALACTCCMDCTGLNPEEHSRCCIKYDVAVCTCDEAD